ncbi:MAG: YIP1 family protein [Candidatus Saccharicenans sp.]|uniref:YIP1 family protein n=1 Tax=Candidatus Saccharicenans sp. TaxID=2819258 RepID=UPI0040499279
MNLGQRFIGVFTAPRETFTALAEKPAWIEAMVIVLVATFIFGFLIAPFSAKDTAELMDNSPKMKQMLRERMGEEGYSKYMEKIYKEAQATSTGYKVQTGLSVSIMAVLALFLQSILLLVFGRLISGSVHGNYRQLLSGMFHASFINAVLGNVLRFILITAKQSVYKISTGLAVFFPRLEFTSAPYIILNSIDFFQLWIFGVLGYALSAIFKVDLKKSLIISYLFWVLKTAVNIALGLWGMSRYQ